MKQEIQLKTLLGIVFCLFIAFGFFQNANASVADNVWGWAWSENIGWISFNCNNPEITAPRCVAPNNYGVNIAADGTFSGYAWSENIGWISFNSADLAGCPAAPCEAKVDASGIVSGWARILVNGGGWDGWIHLRNDAKNYGVSVNTGNGEFSGYAWSENIGWISFNCLNQGVCPVSSYKVTTLFSFNPPPYVVPGTTNTIQNYCGLFAGKGQVSFFWTYEDTDGEEQTQYRIQITKDSDPSFLAPVADCTMNEPVLSGSQGSAGSVVLSPVAGCNPIQLGYGESYLWRVKVKDKTAEATDFYPLAGVPFSTAAHPYPWVDFDFFPASPSIGEEVTLLNSSLCYDGSGGEVPCKEYLWDIDVEGTADFVPPSDSTTSSPVIRFITRNLVGKNAVSLKVTDFSGYFCQDSKTVSTKLHLPEWIEVPPVSFISKLLAAILNFLRL